MACEASPAHAGIDRALVILGRYRLRFPRTRGDRPDDDAA